MTQVREDRQTLEQLESKVKKAVVDLMKFTGFDGFVLDMPAGSDRPLHLVVVGRTAEISWLLDQRAARQRGARH